MYFTQYEFRMICEKIKNRDKAERFLRNWLFRAEFSGIRYLKKFAKTLRNWWEEFLNYFDEGVTQGFVEGINRAIRGIINRAFGYHKFKNFRRKGKPNVAQTNSHPTNVSRPEKINERFKYYFTISDDVAEDWFVENASIELLKKVFQNLPDEERDYALEVLMDL